MCFHLRVSADDYLIRIAPARNAVLRLRSEFLDDLDEENGGFGWWNGFSDGRRTAIASDYLISSADGVIGGLGSASLAAKIFGEVATNDEFRFRREMNAAAKARMSGEAALSSYVNHDAQTQRRLTEGRDAAEHTIYHLVQVADRLAALIIGVGAIGSDLLSAGWAGLAAARKEEWYDPKNMKAAAKRMLASEGPGRELQIGLLDAATAAIADAGPTDWFPWLMRSRNTNAHRAPRMTWHMLDEQPLKMHRIVVPFDAQPGWSGAEALVAEAKAIDGLFVMKDPHQTLLGLVESMCKATSTISEALLAMWTTRRNDPSMLPQPARQWATLHKEQPLKFQGYGSDLKIMFGDPTIRIHPETARRLKASKMMDDQRKFWQDEPKGTEDPSSHHPE